MNECEDCDRLDCRERGCIAPRTYEDEIKRQALESSGLALWSAYCDKKMELEDALDRIEALEAALRKIAWLEDDSQPGPDLQSCIYIARYALSSKP